MDTKYVWVCSECGEQFEGSGPGMYVAWKHGREEHGLKPGQCISGVMDRDTHDMVMEGTGTGVLIKGRKLGFLLDNPDKHSVEIDAEEDPDDAPKNAKPAAKERPLTPRERLELSKNEKQAQLAGRVVMKDIALDNTSFFLFYEAQALWPERYPDDSPAAMSVFIRDCVIFFAMKAKMNTIHIDLTVLSSDREEEYADVGDA